MQRTLLTSVKPAYDELMTYTVELEKEANDDDGAWKFPEGDKFYAAALKNTTTTDYKTGWGFSDWRTGSSPYPFRRCVGSWNWSDGKQITCMSFWIHENRYSVLFSKHWSWQIGNTKHWQQESLTACVWNWIYFFKTKPKAQIVCKTRGSFSGTISRRNFLWGSITWWKKTRYLLYQFIQPEGSADLSGWSIGLSWRNSRTSYAGCHRAGIERCSKIQNTGGNVAYVEGWALYSELIPKEIGFIKIRILILAAWVTKYFVQQD